MRESKALQDFFGKPTFSKVKILNRYKSLIIFLVLASLYLLFGYGVTVSNDSVTNIDQITALDLWSRSSHFSFHLFGIIFYLLFSKLLGLNAVISIELMLTLFSAAGSAALFQITLKKYNNLNQAIITVIIYAFASGIFRFSCQVEYLILVPSLSLMSLYFYSRGNYVFAGIVFSLSLLTSFLSILFAPMFFLYTTPKALLKKQNIIFALSLLVILIVVQFFTYKDSLSGQWSYGQQIELYKSVLGDINFLRSVSILIYGYLRSFNVVLFILPFVLYYLFNQNKELFYIFAVTLIIHFPVAIPEARYGGYQMTAYPVIAVSAGYFFNNLFNKRRYVTLIIIVLYSGINIFLVFSERTFFRDLKDTYVQLNSDLDSNSVLIVYQAIKPIKNIYAPNLQVHDLLSDYQNKLAIHHGYIPTDINEILNNNKNVYLLESGVSMPDDYLKLLVSRFTKSQGAKVKGFALDKVLQINTSLKKEKLSGYPLDVYKLIKKD